MPSKLPKNIISLSRFILRQQSLKLYKDFMKSLKLVEDIEQRKELYLWIRQEFEKNKHYTDEVNVGKRNYIKHTHTYYIYNM